MRSLAFLLLSLLLLGSCATTAPKIKGKRLEAYVNKFYYLYKKDVKRPLVLLVNRKGSHYNRLTDIVYINRKKWEKGDHWYRYMLIFHELSHAVLKRKHEKFVDIGDGCPTSAMYYKITATCFEGHVNHYVEELFSKENTMFPFNLEKK